MKKEKKAKALDTLEKRMRRGAESQRGLQFSAVATAVAGIGTAISFAATSPVWWQSGLAVLALIGLGYYAWNQWQEHRETGDVYKVRLEELLGSTWYAISFASAEQAAEFVAELGPHLEAPRHDPASYEEDVEVSATSVSGATMLYLSESAMQTAKAALAAPLAREVRGQDLPANRVAVLVGAPNAAIGRDEVLKRLPARNLAG